jgi:probable HAF family extracellular repeat protein
MDRHPPLPPLVRTNPSGRFSAQVARLATLESMDGVGPPGDRGPGQDSWQLTELDLLPGGHHGCALGVNDEGVIVGQSETADGTHHAVVWREGRITDLGTLGGLNSQACDVNRHGVVVGASDTPTLARHAFIWRNGQLIDLGGRGSLGGTFMCATAINDRGWVVGSGMTAKGSLHAFVWWAGEMIDLGTLAPGAYQSSRAYDVDDRGRIVGEATVDNMNSVPVMWEDGRIHRLTDIWARAAAINSSGQVAICSSPECFVWSPDDLTTISPDESPTALRAQGIDRPDRGSRFVQVEGIDREGRVVGWNARAAFIWHRGEFEWLPGLSTGQSQAMAIGDQGRFVAGTSSSAPHGLAPHPVVWTKRHDGRAT